MAAIPYNQTELLICIASRQMTDNTSAFIGTGIPMLAAALAKRMHAPNLVTVFEFGGVAPDLAELPHGVGGSRTYHRAQAALGICDVMDAAARGLIEYGFLGGAQIDPYGNLNSTVLGDQARPKVRFPGSGGANDIGSSCWRTIAIMPHDARKFVPKVDFVTTAGYLGGPGAREAAGLPADSGPYRVVTNLALLGYEEESKRMQLLAVNPGVTVEQVVENTGFELLMAPEIGGERAPHGPGGPAAARGDRPHRALHRPGVIRSRSEGEAEHEPELGQVVPVQVPGQGDHFTESAGAVESGPGPEDGPARVAEEAVALVAQNHRGAPVVPFDPGAHHPLGEPVEDPPPLGGQGPLHQGVPGPGDLDEADRFLLEDPHEGQPDLPVPVPADHPAEEDVAQARGRSYL